MIEAIFAGLIILAALVCISAIPAAPGTDERDDLELMSADLLHVLQYASGSIACPGLAQVLASQTAWDEQSLALASYLRSFMPAGYKACLLTPYGDAGDSPPDCAAMSVRPFLAYRQETGEMIECSLIVWRP